MCCSGQIILRARKGQAQQSQIFFSIIYHNLQPPFFSFFSCCFHTHICELLSNKENSNWMQVLGPRELQVFVSDRFCIVQLYVRNILQLYVNCASFYVKSFWPNPNTPVPRFSLTKMGRRCCGHAWTFDTNGQRCVDGDGQRYFPLSSLIVLVCPSVQPSLLPRLKADDA